MELISKLPHIKFQLSVRESVILFVTNERLKVTVSNL